MYSNITVSKVSSVLSAAMLACTMLAGHVSAEGRPVTVTLKVSTRGLDIKTSAGAQELYARVKNAAWIACTRANRVGLVESQNPEACAESALGKAIQSANIGQLTQIYLEAHTLREASVQAIGVPTHMAAQ